jgi:hypothetical protein
LRYEAAILATKGMFIIVTSISVFTFIANLHSTSFLRKRSQPEIRILNLKFCRYVREGEY